MHCITQQEVHNNECFHQCNQYLNTFEQLFKQKYSPNCSPSFFLGAVSFLCLGFLGLLDDKTQISSVSFSWKQSLVMITAVPFVQVEPIFCLCRSYESVKLSGSCTEQHGDVMLTPNDGDCQLSCMKLIEWCETSILRLRSSLLHIISPLQDEGTSISDIFTSSCTVAARDEASSILHTVDCLRGDSQSILHSYRWGLVDWHKKLSEKRKYHLHPRNLI